MPWNQSTHENDRASIFMLYTRKVCFGRTVCGPLIALFCQCRRTHRPHDLILQQFAKVLLADDLFQFGEAFRLIVVDQSAVNAAVQQRFDGGICVRKRTDTAASNTLIALDGMTLHQPFQRVVLDGTVPVDEVFAHGQQITDFIIGQDGRQTQHLTASRISAFASRNLTDRNAILKLSQCSVLFGTGTTLGLATAEPTPIAGVKLRTVARKSGLCCGLYDFPAPFIQSLDSRFIGVNILSDTGLNDGHANTLDRVAVHRLILFHRTDGVQLHLRIFHRRNRNALSVLVIGDVDDVITNHHVIASAKTVRHEYRKVNVYLACRVRHHRIAVRLFHEVIRVELGAVEHLVSVVGLILQLFERIVEFLLIQLPKLVPGIQFAELMRQCTFLGKTAGAAGEIQLKTRSGGAIQPAMGGTAGAKSVFTRCRHIHQPPLVELTAQSDELFSDHGILLRTQLGNCHNAHFVQDRGQLRHHALVQQCCADLGDVLHGVLAGLGLLSNRGTRSNRGDSLRNGCDRCGSHRLLNSRDRVCHGSRDRVCHGSLCNRGRDRSHGLLRYGSNRGLRCGGKRRNGCRAGNSVRRLNGGRSRGIGGLYAGSLDLCGNFLSSGLVALTAAGLLHCLVSDISGVDDRLNLDLAKVRNGSSQIVHGSGQFGGLNENLNLHSDLLLFFHVRLSTLDTGPRSEGQHRMPLQTAKR
nr:MAG TPA: hypothetical protein [Caudoviricetes sp.]